MATQLRRCLSAEDSAEVAKEVQHHGLLGPEVTEPVRYSLVVLQDHLGESRHVHEISLRVGSVGQGTGREARGQRRSTG